MPLPEGAHYEKGSLGRFVILNDGTRVKKSAAYNLGAKNLGFRSDHEYRKFLKQLKKTDKLHRLRRNRFEKKQKASGASRGEIKNALYKFDQTEAKFYMKKMNGEKLDYTNGGEATQHMIACGFRRDQNDRWDSDPIE